MASITPARELSGSEGSERALVQREEQQLKIVVLAIAFFAMIVEFFVYLSTSMQACMPRVTHVAPILDEEIQANIDRLLPEVEELRAKIQHFDTFVQSHPQLLRQCKAAWQEYGTFVTRIGQEIPVYDESDTLINQEKALRLQKVDCEHRLEIRMTFISSYPTLFKAFKEHLVDAPSYPGTAAGGSTGIIIEELPDDGVD